MVAVVAKAFVHTIQVQVNAFKATEHSVSQALCVCLMFAGGCVEVLVEVVHLGILPPVPVNAKETYLVRVSTSWDSLLWIEFAQAALRSFASAIPALVESLHPVVQARLQDVAAEVFGNLAIAVAES